MYLCVSRHNMQLLSLRELCARRQELASRQVTAEADKGEMQHPNEIYALWDITRRRVVIGTQLSHDAAEYPRRAQIS
jgi:hypothetical protein